MSDKFEEFKEKVQNADNAPLIDSLIDHAKKSDENIDYYEVTKIIKHEILKRLKQSIMFFRKRAILLNKPSSQTYLQKNKNSH